MSSAETKQNGKSINGAAREYALASRLAEDTITIDSFVGPWHVTLQAGARGLWDEGQKFEVSSQSATTGEITFQPSGVQIPAQFDGRLEVLKYQNRTVSGQISLLTGTDRKSLSGVSFVGDPDPIIIWAAEEGG